MTSWRCTNRHWFTLYGRVGVRAPTCVRYGCDEPNPKWREADHRAEYEATLREIERWHGKEGTNG